MDNDKIEKYEWCADFETGVEIIDKEHRQLFKIIKIGRASCRERV